MDRYNLLDVLLVIVILMTLAAISVIALVLLLSTREPKECLKSHTEHRGAWIQFIPSGKILIPVTHPARDVEVCDEYKS